jgi:hypothetical protein
VKRLFAGRNFAGRDYAPRLFRGDGTETAVDGRVLRLRWRTAEARWEVTWEAPDRQLVWSNDDGNS